MWQDFIQQANQFGKAKTPFFFLIDFEQQKPILCPLNQMDEQGIFVQFPDYTNVNWREDLPIAPFIYINSQ
jgi:para-aminobenzoate synthetase component 1